MLRKVLLKIRLDPGQTLGPLANSGWHPVTLPGASGPGIDTVEGTFETDAEFVQAVSRIGDSSTVLEATLKDVDRTFYHLDESAVIKLGSPESLLDAALRIITEVASGGDSEPRVAAAGESATKPKPTEAAIPCVPQEIMTGVPKIPDLVWKTIEKSEGQAAARSLIEKATSFETDRKERAAWNPTRENALMAHLKDDATRADIAWRLLKEIGGLTDEHMAANKAKTEILQAAVDATRSINAQLKRWTDLSKQVVPLLAAMSLVGVLLILVCLELLRAGRLNGTEMALLAFVFTLSAISPATLLLIGRPLRGLDQWSPSGARTDEAAPKADAGGKPTTPKTTEPPK